ncbi:MAG: baseplate J/gp47 family protein [Candidatus Vogelbacteria bacterium]|nr:baseplate J/gp47 family protein [Candidatus Vogelbacteria bacterium]
MSKKIFQDIITKAVGSVHEEVSVDGNKGRVSNRPRRGVGNKFLVSVSLIVLGAVVVLALFLLFSSSFSRVSLKVTTSRKVFDLNDKITLNKNGMNGDIKYDIMKLEDLESTKVSITGSKRVQRNAIGVVTIYNYGKTVQRLVIGTRVETNDGKIYKIQKAILVPSNKLGTGSVDVAVRAEQAGDNYNIPPSDFILPGLKGGTKFDLIRAKSHKNIIGGFVGEIKTVSPADLQKARQQLREVITQKLTKNAILQVPKGFILYSDSMFLSFTDNVIDNSALVDSTEGQASLTMSGALSSIIIDQNELRNYLVSKTIPDLNKNVKVILLGLEKLDFHVLNKEKVVLGGDQSIKADISGSIRIIWDFDDIMLKDKLVGIKKSNYQDVFRQFSSIEKAEAVFSPSWALYFPNDPQRITIDKGF